MTVAAALVLFLGAAAVEVDLAPDQPLPFVYVDDPLIVELAAEADIEATVDLSVNTGQWGTPVETRLGTFSLCAASRRWCTVPDLPAERGYYTTRIQVSAGDVTQSETGYFCRIDRLTPGRSCPLVASVPNPEEPGSGYHNGDANLALSAVGIHTLRWDASRPDLEERLEEAANTGFKAILYFDASRSKDIEELAEYLARKHAGAVCRWDLAALSDVAQIGRIAEGIKKAGSAAPLAIVLSSPNQMASLFAQGLGRYVCATVLEERPGSPAPVAEIHRAAERAGYERWRVDVLVPPQTPRPDGPGAILIQRFFEHLMSGAVEIAFDPALVYDGELHEALVYLNGLVHRFLSAEFVGSLPCGAAVSAPVFRSGAAWLVPLWTPGMVKETAIQIGDAQELQLTDALNNPRPVPQQPGDMVTITVGGDLVYLSGLGGSVLGHAARFRAASLAQECLDDERIGKYLPDELLEVLRRAAAKKGALPREDFFLLLRSFPELERRWHLGELPRTIAVPAIAALARLARPMCLLEEERGEPFLEPLSDTFARCEQYQSLYLTGSIGTSQAHDRGDWLLNEVRRLMDESEALAAANRKTEASAVAALAEWRARGLEFAARAGTAPEITEEELEAAHTLATDNTPAQAFPAPDHGASVIMHTVVRGDNPSRIAGKYGVDVADFLKWNNLKGNTVLQIGEQYVIHLPERSTGAR